MRNKNYSVGLIIPVHKKDVKFLPRVFVNISYLKKYLNIIDVVFIFNGYTNTPYPKRENGFRFLKYPNNLIIGNARNIAASKVNSDFLIFMDADVSITENTAINLHAAIKEMVLKRYTALMPRLKQYYGNSPWSGIDSFEDKRSYETRGQKNNVKIIFGPFLVIRSKEFKSLGGFEDRNFSAEDRDLACRLLINRKRIFFDKRVEVCHQNSPSLQRILYRKFFHARCNALIYERYPNFYHRNLREWFMLIISKYTSKYPLQSSIYVLIMIYYFVIFTYFRVELRLIHPKDIQFKKSDLFR